MNTQNNNSSARVAPESPAAWIGWDWADQKHDIFLESAEGRTEKIKLPHQPGQLHAWLKELGQRFEQRKVVLAIEACQSALLPIFLQYSFLELYLINPKSLACFREAVRPSGSKSDELDSKLACQLVKAHRSLLSEFVVEDELTRELSLLVSYRRDLVDQRSALANQLKSILKVYYPLALDMLQDDTTTALAADFILKFPTLRVLQQTSQHEVRKFFKGHGYRLTKGLEERLESVAPAAAVTTDAAWNNPHSFMTCAVAEQLKSVLKRVEQIAERICILVGQHPNYALAQSLPGAAEVLEARVIAVLGTRVDACSSAENLSVRDGVAPRRIQSGNSCLTVRRLAKPQFEHQTWIEYAKSSLLTCAWAQAFVEAKRKEGKTYYTAVRALALKWIRIIHACWKNGTIYDEATYLAALKKNSSPYASQNPSK
jgi:transposase